MKKIIHLSDPHVGHRACSDQFFQACQTLKSQRGAQAGNIVLVITGDLIENANNQDDFYIVKEGFDDLKKAGFQHILVVPGNHDYGTGNRGDKKFVAFFRDLFYSDDQEFPRLDIIDGIAMIGLDSMAEELNWYDDMWAEGELGEAQLSRLETLLGREAVRACQKKVLYLHHHPFDYRPFHQLKDSSKLRAVLIRAATAGISIDAILYGHNHQGRSHNGEWGIPRCYDAGSVTLKPRPGWVDWIPWYRSKSAVREIDFSRDDPHLDRILQLL